MVYDPQSNQFLEVFFPGLNAIVISSAAVGEEVMLGVKTVAVLEVDKYFPGTFLNIHC